jgi:predicted permease
VFVAVQVAFALVLLAGAGLLLKSLSRLLDAPLGFRPEGVLTARYQLPPTWEQESRRLDHLERLLAELRRNPHVRDAASVMTLPLGDVYNDTGYQVDGQPPPPPDRPNVAGRDAVSPGYFRTMGIPFVERGSRDFDARDGEGAPLVAIVNRAMAKRAWPNRSAIGGTFSHGRRHYTVVGVVEDVRRFSLREPERPHHYLPYAQLAPRLNHLVVRVNGDPAAFARELSRIAAAVDPTVPIARVEPLSAAVRRSAATARFVSGLLALFAAAALVLAGLGLYGMLSYLVSQRRREIGVRLAIGAQPADIVTWIARRGLALSAIGAAAGLLATLPLTRLLAGLLYQVRPHDPATLAAVSAVLLAVAAGSCALPARRAARVDPMETLRSE